MLTVGTTSDGLAALERAGNPYRGLYRFVEAAGSAEAVHILWHRHSLSRVQADRLYPRLRSLRHVHVDTAGTDHIAHLIRPGVTVSSAGAAQTLGVAEWVVAAVLWDAKRLAAYQRNSDRGAWAHPAGVFTVKGRTLASFGAGHILAAALPALTGLGINVVATSKHVGPVDGATVLGRAEWVRALPGASWLLLDAPLTDDTRHTIDEPTLAHLDGACLINLARGELLAPGAAGWARRQGHLRSAVLDVHRTEPLPGTHPAWADQDILVTPHDAWRGDHVMGERVTEFLAVLARMV